MQERNRRDHLQSKHKSECPSPSDHAAYLKHCGGHPVCACFLSFTLWLSLCNCVLMLHRPSPLSLRSHQMAKAKSTHCYLWAAQSLSVCLCLGSELIGLTGLSLSYSSSKRVCIKKCQESFNVSSSTAKGKC